MSRVLSVPVGDRPAWELEDQSMNIEQAPWHSVPDSSVILQSLKQSRDRWVSSAFPKLPKSRGMKQAGVNIPIHEYKAHDRFELSVGPHIFPDTSLFEAVYKFTNDRSTAAPTAGYLSPEMQHLISAAAVHNPELFKLLEEARVRKLPEEDTIRLADLLRTLNLPNLPVAQAPAQHLAWDLVIEFKEKPLDRRIFPRGSVQVERVYETYWGRRFDAMVITTLPYSQQQIGVDLQISGQQDTLATPNDVSSPQPVTFHWRGLTQRTFELLERWSQTSLPLDPSLSEQLLSRVYLPHQLPDGELFDMVRGALAPPYSMKSIRPANADSGRTKRRNTRRKSTVEQPTNTSAIPADAVTQQAPSMGGQFSTFSVVQMTSSSTTPNPPSTQAIVGRPIDSAVHTSPAAPVPSAAGYSSTPVSLVFTSAHTPAPMSSSYATPSHVSGIPPPQATTVSASPAPTPQNDINAPLTIPQPSQPRIQRTEPQPKRKRSRYEPPPPTCKSCHQSNVQLMHGGWYCRACVEARRFIVPEVVVPPRASASSSGGTSHQSGHRGLPSPGTNSPIVPGTQFSHWTPPSD